MPSSTATAVSLDAHPLATCLDGTAARYYYSPGLQNSTTWLIFFEGGGFCGSLDDCRQRATTYYGSTSQDTPTMSLSDRYYFSRDARDSPLLSGAHHVYVRYCDGAYYSGERHDALLSPSDNANDGSNSSAPLYFRGRWITDALLADLRAHRGLERATDIVLAGCSAGAIRIFAHLDALRRRLPSIARTVGFADSGFYLDRPMFTNLKRFVVDAHGHNATRLLSRTCRSAHPTALERCLIAEVNGHYLESEVFAFQSRYDLDQRSCEIGPACAASPTCINAYGANMTAAVHAWQRAGGGALPAGRRHGFFLDGCSRHCDGSDAANGSFPLHMRAPPGASPLQALASWYAGGREAVWAQAGAFPCDECCGR